MGRRNITTGIAIFTLIFSAQAFAMMGGMGGSNGQNMTGQEHHQTMTSADHDQYMTNQAGNHLPQAGQGHMDGDLTDQRSRHLDHDNHQAMGNSQMQDEAEDFFRE